MLHVCQAPWKLIMVLCGFTVAATSTLVVCQQTEVEKLYERALSNDPQVAAAAVRELAKYPGTGILLLPVIERPGGERYNPVRIAAINALAADEEEDYSLALSQLLHHSTPVEIRLATVSALLEHKCSWNCVIQAFMHMDKIWATERAIQVGAIEPPTPEEAEKEKLLKEKLIELLQREKEATVRFVKELYDPPPDEPDEFIVWLATQLQAAELCPLLEHFQRVAAEDAREEIRKAITSLECCKSHPE